MKCSAKLFLKVVIKLVGEVKDELFITSYLHLSMKQSKDNPLGVKAMKRIQAKPQWAFANDGKRSSA